VESGARTNFSRVGVVGLNLRNRLRAPTHEEIPGGIMRRLSVVVILLLLSVPALANEAFICVADSATGFAFDRTQKKWRPANFGTGNKYLVSKSKTSGEWGYKPAGGRIQDSPCSSEHEDELICDDAYGWEFRMNRYNLRFLHVQRQGYWDDGTRTPKKYVQEGERRPYMEIGTCSPL
jgi:hypothetical protein